MQAPESDRASASTCRGGASRGGATGFGSRGPRRYARRARGAGSRSCAEMGRGEVQAWGAGRGSAGGEVGTRELFSERDPGANRAGPGVRLAFGTQKCKGPERVGGGGRNPAHFPGRVLGTSQEIPGLNLRARSEGNGFYRGADKGPQCVFALIFPTFQELLRLVPQVFGNSTTPSLHMVQSGLHPENTARPCCPSRTLPLFQFQQDWGEGKSPGPQDTSRKISRFQDFLFPLLFSWLQQTLLYLAEVLKGFPQEGRREQPQLAPFRCSLCKRGHVWGGGAGAGGSSFDG